MVSGTVAEAMANPTFFGFSIDLLIFGSLSLVAFSVAGLVAVVVVQHKDVRDSVHKDSLVGMVNPILTTTYQLWQNVGERVEETETFTDDIAYSFINAPVDVVADWLREQGYVLTVAKDTQDEGLVVSTTEEISTG